MTTPPSTIRWRALAFTAFIALVWLNQSVGGKDWEALRDRTFSEPGSGAFDLVRYPFVFLYRRSGDEANGQRPGIRMLCDVAERLLGDAVERDVDVRVEPNRIECRGHVERAPALEGVEQMGDQLGQVDVGQLVGPQFEEQ